MKPKRYPYSEKKEPAFVKEERLRLPIRIHVAFGPSESDLQARNHVSIRPIRVKALFRYTKSSRTVKPSLSRKAFANGSYGPRIIRSSYESG